MEPLFHIQPPLATTTLAQLNDPFEISVQLVFLDGRAPERVLRVELWSNLPRGYEWSSWELVEVDEPTVSGLPDEAVVKSYRGVVHPAKIGFHEFTIRAIYCDQGREDTWWAGSFQKNGKVFVTDAEPKFSLKPTDVLLGIDPAWFVNDSGPEIPPDDPQAETASNVLNNADHRHAMEEEIVVLSGYLQFPVETAYWARIFPVGLVNCLGLIRRNVWWLEPNTYLGSEKPTVFFLFERSDRMFVLLIPLTMNGVSAAILPQKDASVGVQITLEHNNDGQARIFVMVGSGRPHLLVEKAVSRIRKLLHEAAMVKDTSISSMDTSRRRPQREPPAWYDRLGMCTWNMFYKNPTHEGISRALDTMVHQLKIPMGFLILDDGWQRTTQLERLTSFEPDAAKFDRGLGAFIRDVKLNYNLEHVGIWIPIQGYWNGIEPDSELGRKYQLRQIASRGNVWLVEATDVRRFFSDAKDYLADQGVDFYKIDNQASFDLYMGEVSYDSAPLWKHYQDAMSETFEPDVVLSMAQSPNIIFNTLLLEPKSRQPLRPLPVARNSDDFHPERLDMHAGHVYTNAINNIWSSAFGFGIPDWDMFQSDGPYGAFHAAARSLNNGPIYIADEPNAHDPSVLRPLFVGGVAGSEHRVLRPLYPALPSVDSVFADARDVRKSLKICNVTTVDGNTPNGTCYVAGLFNCTTFSLCDRIKPEELIESVGWRADLERQHGECLGLRGKVAAEKVYAAYVFHRRTVRRIVLGDPGLPVFLRPATFEIVTFAPIARLGNVEIACLGLADKYNGSVALLEVDVLPGVEGSAESIGYRVILWARGRTAFFVGGMESPLANLHICIDGEEVPPHLFSFEAGLLLVDARMDGNEMVKSVAIDVTLK